MLVTLFYQDEGVFCCFSGKLARKTQLYQGLSPEESCEKVELIIKTSTKVKFVLVVKGDVNLVLCALSIFMTGNKDYLKLDMEEDMFFTGIILKISISIQKNLKSLTK